MNAHVHAQEDAYVHASLSEPIARMFRKSPVLMEEILNVVPVNVEKR